MKINVGDLINNKWVQVAAASTGTFVLGYFVGKRNGDVYEVVTPDYTGDDLESLNNSYQAHATFDYGDHIIEGTPVPIEYYTAVVKDQYVENTNQLALAIEPKTTSIFAKSDDIWDEEAERAYRESNEIYVLHQDEYIRDERDYRQETVTYYAGDDIMADPADTPIYNHYGLMGELRFGHGSGDKSVVYIRNENERREWEVILHTGKYEIEVLGHELEQELEESIRHSSTRLKFRDI